jgi:tRNA dimethylallyltransferase
LQIGISHPKEKLWKRIEKRLKQRFEEGMIEEVQKLHSKDGLSWKRLRIFGLGYKIISEYLSKEVYPVKFERSETGKAVFNRELFQKVYQSEKNYAKRQMTWFKKDKRIIWLENYKDIEKEVEKFLG